MKRFSRFAAFALVAGAIATLASCSGSSSSDSSTANDSVATEAAVQVKGEVIEVTTDQYATEIADYATTPMEYKGTKPAIIDFWATWCGPCMALTPVLHEVTELSGITVYKVNVDECPDVAQAYGIQAIPALLLCKDGKITPYEGDRSDADLLATAKRLME